MDNSRAHFLKYLKEGFRYGNRKLDDFREISLETGILETAEGSARVKLGNTEILVGIKMDVGEPFADTPNYGVLMVGAELLPLSNPEFESGPPSVVSIELARVVDRGLREAKSIDTKALCIEAGKKVWIINADICAINDDGNLLDASAIGVLAALKNTKLPEIVDGNIDFKKKSDKSIKINNNPLTVTVFKLGDKLFVDPTGVEEKIYDSRLTVAAIEDGTICAMQKGGDYALTEKDISSMIDLALRKIQDIRRELKL